MNVIKTALVSDVTGCDAFICAAELGFSPLGVFLGHYEVDAQLVAQTCAKANNTGEPELIRDGKYALIVTPVPNTRRAIKYEDAYNYAYTAFCLCRDQLKAETVTIAHLSGHTFPPACFDGILDAIRRIEAEGPGTIKEINIYDCCLSVKCSEPACRHGA
jgi:hypothetical protein